MSHDDQTYGLVLPFDTDNEEFVRGWQLGMLWARMEDAGRAEGLVYTRSAEMVMRIAESKGVPFTATVHDDTWTWVTIGEPS